MSDEGESPSSPPPGYGQEANGLTLPNALDSEMPLEDIEKTPIKVRTQLEPDPNESGEKVKTDNDDDEKKREQTTPVGVLEVVRVGLINLIHLI